VTGSARTPEAVRALETLIQLRSRSRDSFLTALEESPWLFPSGHPAFADAIEKAVARTQDLAFSHFWRGVKAFMRKDFENAVVELKEVVRLRDFDAYPQVLLGEALGEIQRNEDATESLLKAVRISKNNAHYRYILALQLYKTHKYDLGLQYISEAIKIDPRYALYHAQKAALLQALNRPRDASSEYRLAIVLNKHLPEAHDGLGRLLRGQSHGELAQESPRLAEAITEFKKAIADSPERGQYHADLGNALEDEGKDEEAAWEFNKALSLYREEFHAPWGPPRN